MQHLEAPEFLGLLFVMFAAAKLLGALAQAVGQPSVLGELLAGVLVGKSVLGLVDPSEQVFHLLGELGVVILLFSIGLETDLKTLLKAGPSASAVALAGVVLPFVLGYGLSIGLGLPNLAAIVLAAAMTATSVGITARVLSDLGRLQGPEGQVILGAAILDDVIGLVILTVVAGLAAGAPVTTLGVLKTTGVAFGFLLATIAVGKLVVPRIMLVLWRVQLPGTPTILALLLAFGLGWLADRAGSAMILGAFAGGLLIVGLPQEHEIEAGVTRLGHFFVPLFFVTVGAAVNVGVLNPLVAANHRALTVGGVLAVAAVAGKFAAGYAPFWFKGNKAIVGAGMIPRGEVGLIFAGMGRATGVLDDGLFAALTVVVLLTTFVAPPLLRHLAPPGPSPVPPRAIEGIEELTTAG